MSLTLEEFNGMEFLWEQLPKKPDDFHVTLTLMDIDAMWYCGMIDTGRFPVGAWQAAFAHYRRPDDTYLLSRGDFLKMEKYRYKGEIKVPFDANLINEGQYTEEGLKELFDLSIAPSSELSKEELEAFINDFKYEFKDPASKLICMDIRGKMMIRDLLERYPSPLRRLEIIYDYIIKGEEPPLDAFPMPRELDTFSHPEMLARVQTSSFTMRPTSAAEVKHKALTKIVKSKKKPFLASDDGKTSVALKKVKRSRKGIRG